MRIGIDIKAFKNGSTGIARYLRNNMDELQKLDSVNEYVLFEPCPLDYQPSNSKWAKVLIPWRMPGIVWQQFVLPYHLIRHRIDVLWAPEQVCPVFLPRRVRVVTTVHDLAFRRFPQTFVWSNLLIQKWSIRWVLRRSDAVVTVSDFVRRELLVSYEGCCTPDRVMAIPNGGPDWKLPPNYSPSHREDFLFFAGNLEPRKNLVTLIKALEILHNRGMDIPLHLAGPSGWRNAPLYRTIDASPIKANVHLLGYLSEEKLREQYLTCRALVYPSLYEGFGIPVLEALASDCPVLTSKGTVMEEVAKDCAFYADPTSPLSFADAIETLMRRGKRRRRSSETVLHRYTWKASAEQLLVEAFGAGWAMLQGRAQRRET